MSTSLSRGKPLEVGTIGVAGEHLPGLDEGPINLQQWFGSGRETYPLVLEIGCGKGTFLVQAASQNPGINYVGLEYAMAYWRYAADRCRRHGLENVRLVHVEAGSFVRNYVPDKCLQQVHVYFPDPWPKKRHHKRRLIQQSFLCDLHRKLEAGGIIRLATDHADYHQWMLEHATAVTDLFESLPFTSPLSLATSEESKQDELVGTNFERKYRREGRSFHAFMLRSR